MNNYCDSASSTAATLDGNRPESNLVVTFKPESQQLKSKTYQPCEAVDTQGEERDQYNASIVDSVGTIVAFSVAECADLVDASRQAILKAIADGRLRADRGASETGHNKGRNEFRINSADLFSFNPQARTRWEAREAARLVAQQMDREEAAAAARQAKLIEENPSKTDYAAACAWHLQECARFTEAQGVGRKMGRVLYSRALDQGQIILPDWVRKGRIMVSDRTLERWEQKLKTGGAAALDPHWGTGGRTPYFETHTDQRNFVLSLLAQKPHLTAKKFWEALKAHYGVERVPAIDAVTRFLKHWKAENPEEYLRMRNPDKAKSKYQVAFGSRSEHVVRLNQLWETDASPNDFMFLKDRHRYVLCAAVDVYSDRRRFLLTPSPRGLAHGLLFRMCLKDWGLPEVIKTDNGKDYTSAYMTRFFADLGIEQTLCKPFSGEEKPHVERGFRTFFHDLVEMLPGYTGHNVAQAQDLRAQKSFADRLKEAKRGDVVEAGMTREEFEDFMNRWILADEHRVRQSDRLKGKTPHQVVDAWAAENPVRRVLDMQAVDTILLPAFPKTIQKKGIRHENRFYIAPELGEIIGRQVEIRQSPDDAGRVMVFKDGEFFCLAEDPEMTGVSRSEIAARAREHQKAAGKAQREVQRELKKLVQPQAVAEEILQDRLRAVDPVSRFQTADPISSTALAAAAAAKAADSLAALRDRQQPAPIPQLDPAEEAEIRAAMVPKAPLEDPKDRFIRLLRAPFVPAQDREWMDYFATTPEGEGILLGFHPYKQA